MHSILYAEEDGIGLANRVKIQYKVNDNVSKIQRGALWEGIVFGRVCLPLSRFICLKLIFFEYFLFISDTSYVSHFTL